MHKLLERQVKRYFGKTLTIDSLDENLINLLKKTLKTFSRFFCLYMETKKLLKYNSFQIKPYIHLTYRTIKLHSPLLTNKYLKNHK